MSAAQAAAMLMQLKSTFKDVVDFQCVDESIRGDNTIGVKGPRQICKKLQPTLDGNPIWIIRQSELFTADAIKHLVASASTQVILVGSNVVKHRPGTLAPHAEAQ